MEGRHGAWPGGWVRQVFAQWATSVPGTPELWAGARPSLAQLGTRDMPVSWPPALPSTVRAVRGPCHCCRPVSPDSCNSCVYLTVLSSPPVTPTPTCECLHTRMFLPACLRHLCLGPQRGGLSVDISRGNLQGVDSLPAPTCPHSCPESPTSGAGQGDWATCPGGLDPLARGPRFGLCLADG